MSKRKASTERPRVDRESRCIIHMKDSNLQGFVHFSDQNEPAVRFKTICDVRGKRLAQPVNSVHRMQNICEQIPDKYNDTLGYHRDCYQRFTMNLNRLKPVASTTSQSEEEPERSRRSLSCDQDKTLFNPDCIFCNSSSRKKAKIHGVWTTEGLSSFEFGGGENIKQLATERRDEYLLRRIRGQDLFACEAKYHRVCRMNYNDPTKWRSSDEDAKQRVKHLESVHDVCYAKICEVIDSNIIEGNRIMKMIELRDLYIGFLSETPFPNPNYRAETLKLRLLKSNIYRDKLSFVSLDRMGGKLQTDLVFSNTTDLSEAVKNGYLLGSADHLNDVAIYLRTVISDAFTKADRLPWPPTASYLESMDDPLPVDIQRFLRVLISGQTSTTASDKVERLINSIGQDLCRAATGGKWKLPKHILMCMTLRHLFRSAQLSTLVNRLGHAESYSFALELETALAVALEEVSTLLTPQIIRHPPGQSLFHSDFDNFDQFVNDLSGSGSIHTSHGIMLQDIHLNQSDDLSSSRSTTPSITRTGERSLKVAEHDSLPPCYISQRDGPTMKISRLVIPGIEVAMKTCNQVNQIWCAIREMSSAETQKVPGWGGFISETGQVPQRLTTVDYYPVINHPITEYSTVKACLRCSQEATEEVGQQYVITTFDLGVCMKAYPILWKSPGHYTKHIVMIGTFHLACAYLKMLGKKMNGSGLADVLLEAGAMSSGSMKGVVSGKHYSRSIYCHKSMMEGLERLLLQKYLSTKNHDHPFTDMPPASLEKVMKLVKVRSKDNLESVMTDPVVKLFLDNYEMFRQSARDGKLGCTAQFWLSYMDHVWLVLSLLQAVKTNDYHVYAFCLSKMADLFFSFDGQNYARYLTYFSVFLANLEESHPGATELLKRGAISVARSLVPGNLCAVDKTIEETFMKHAKSHAGAGGKGAGLSGILTNYGAYQRWAKTAHERSKYLEATLQMADMTESSRGNTHRDVRSSQIAKSETATKNIIQAIESFMNPFEVEDNEKLYCISSGAAATVDVQTHALTAEDIGKRAKEEFIKNRLQKNEHFFDPIKRQKLKTLADMSAKVKVKTSNNRIVEYKQQGNLAFQLLVLSQNHDEKVNLREMMRYPLMPVPSSIGTPDGFLMKTDKSKGFHHLTKGLKDASTPPDDTTLNIEDGNATFYCMREVPGTFKQISHKLFDLSTVGKSNVVFSTDMYKENSVKSMERKSRGCGEKRIVKGENTKRPENWKDFLTNDENKKQLVKLILQVWGNQEFSIKLRNKFVIAICEGHAYQLTSDDGESVQMSEIVSLQSDQEETDTRVVLYAKYAEQEKYECVRVRSPDTDIFFILLYYATNLKIRVLFDTGAGNKRRLLDVSKLAVDFTPQYCNSLLALHAFTRCDTTSSFKGIGKVKPLKILQKKPRFQEVFSQLGQTWTVSEDLFLELEQFSCLMYRVTAITEVDELRFLMLTEKCGDRKRNKLNPKKNIDLSTFPPPRVCLREHIKRVNYQVGIWKRAHVAKPDTPPPTQDNGWALEDAVLAPKWCDGEVLPPQLADILQEAQDREQQSGEDSSEDGDSSDDDQLESGSDSD